MCSTVGSDPSSCFTTASAVEVLAAVAVAVDREQHLRLICAKRSITLRAPKSGEQLDQIAPIDAQARNAATASGMFGRYATTRSPGPTPSARKPARDPRHLAPQLALGHLAERPQLRGMANRDVSVGAAAAARARRS